MGAPPDSLAAVLAYHERTKHHPRRFARSPGYLDWASQPDPFRTFAGARTIPLPPAPDGPFAYEDLWRSGARPPVPLDAAAISDFLYHSLAVSATKEAGGSRWHLRVNPSSGNLHPTEGYLALPPVSGVASRPGVYHYLPREHALEERAVLGPETFAAATSGLPPGSFLVGLSSVFWREAWKYGERAFRYCQHDVGHALAALALAAALLGRRLRVLRSWPAEATGALLGLDRDADFPSADEREEPEILAAVVPDLPWDEPPPPSPEAVAAFRGAGFSGRANVLSPSHVDWPAIADVALASRGTVAPRAAVGPEHFASLPAPPPGRPAREARRVLRGRRSAVMYDGRSPVSRDAFLRVLHRTMPGLHGPCSLFADPARIHLALFVHRVTGLAPGLYLLPRRPGAEERLRAALRPDALFTPVPGGLPLRLLLPGDAREIAAAVSCGQEIAGASFASLGMLAEFEETLREGGAGEYRRLLHEAGVVGQVLYLEAEAEGARGTGIGCYFDDLVHELLGLRGRDFQSLYHFTFGRPVEDPRLVG